ncbi:MAG: sucrose phosphorylase, partial [Spirochaetales bacterium]|nr:sucrose phosphorylase [Spirochaetales bacterium]
MKDGLVLITYADSFGGNLQTLKNNLDSYFQDCISGVHILPFFPSSGDRGFSPLNYTEITPEFGSWEDLAAIGERYEIMADVMVNHISRRSEYFKDWLSKEDKSEYASLFLPIRKVFGTDNPSKEELAKVYRRQPSPPWLDITFDSGKNERIWCTFSEQQIDIDISSEAGIKLFTETVKNLSEKGVKTIRLDAVGYITKKKGTTCFMVEPEIWTILSRLKTISENFDVDLLPEMHEHYSIQQKVSEHGFPVYDFALPMLLLYSWYKKDFAPLKNWLQICPKNCYTTLDTHDGIGVVDAADLLTQEQTDFTVEKL